MASESDAARAALFFCARHGGKIAPMAMTMAIAMPPAADVEDDDGGDAAARRRRRGFRQSSQPGDPSRSVSPRRLALDFLMEETESRSRRGLGRVARRRRRKQRQATEPRAQVAAARVRRNREPLSHRRRRDRFSRVTRWIAESQLIHRAFTYLLSWTHG